MGFGLDIGEAIAIADGTLSETRARLGETNLDAVATLLLDEVATRTPLLAAPKHPVDVCFELTHGNVVITRTMTLGPDGPQLSLGRTDNPAVVVRQDLAEALRSVFGSVARSNDATRTVWVMNEPGPETDNPDDPWLQELRDATLAAGQTVGALSDRPPDLGQLAQFYGCDKWGDHFYTPRYEAHFAAYRDQRVRLLEIGVGGFEAADRGGESLRMWKQYFRRGLIYGLDIFDKSPLDERRIKTVVGDQSDTSLLTRVSGLYGPFDIVIDDASHISHHVLASFHTLFPLLEDGGLYVIEDLHTSYWPGWNGGRIDRTDPTTTVGFLKTLLDSLHHQDQMARLPPDIETIGRHIRAVQVYHNLAVIEKGVNQDQTAPSWVRRLENDMDLQPKGSMRRVIPDCAD